MGGTPAIVNVGGGSRNGSCGGYAAKQDRADIAHALRNKFHVAAVMRADHAVGNDAGKQRFDGCQHGDGKAVGKLFAEELGAELGNVQLGKGATDGVEIANGVYIHAQQVHHADAYEYGNERAGDLPVEFRPQEQHHQAS